MFLSVNETGHITATEQEEEKWELINSGLDYYYLKNADENKLLEADLKGNVYLMPFNNLTNQMWHLVNNKVIKNKATSQVLDTFRGQIFSQFPYGSRSQNWIIHFRSNSSHLTSQITSVPITSTISSNYTTHLNNASSSKFILTESVFLFLFINFFTSYISFFNANYYFSYIN